MSRDRSQTHKQGPTVGQSLMDLFKESVVIQSIITLAVVGAIVYLEVGGHAASEQLWGLGGIIIGYWFGSKTNLQVKHLMDTQLRSLREMTKR